GFDRVLRVLCVMIRSQDGTVADARPGRALEGRHGRSRTSHAERRIPARLDTTARVEHVVAELDVLTRNILLVGATTVVATHNPGVGRRSLGPVDPVAFEGDLLCRVVPRGKAGDERGNAPGVGIEDRKSTRLNSSHVAISYAVFCLKKKKKQIQLQES